MLRTLLDGFIFLTHHIGLAFVLFVVLWEAGRRPAARHSLPGFPAGSPLPATRLLAAGLLLVAGTFCAIGVWYLTLDGFAGEVEPAVSSLAWVFQDGRPLYHAADAAERYSLLYGPSVYLTNGLFLHILGPTLMSAKLASFLAAVAGLLLLHGALTSRARSLPALAAVTVAVSLYWSQGFGIYLVRADSLLVFSVAFGLFVVRRAPRFLSLAGLAAILGFAVNLKIHAIVYFAPVLVLAAGRWGWRACGVSLLGAAAVVAAPFALYPQISWENYWGWVRNAADHGLGTQDLVLNLRFAFLLILPLAVTVIGGPGPAARWRSDRRLLTVLAAALVATLVVASKPGAGPVHLLPLVPLFVFVPARIWQAEGWAALRMARPHPRWLVPAVLPAAALTLTLSATVTEYRSTRLIAWQQDQSPGLSLEVQGIMERFPGLGISMACGGENASFRHTWIRPLLVFADNPVLIDPIAVMDCCLAGTPLSPATYRALAEGRIGLWLVPRGQQPFAKTNWYAPHNPIFPVAFQQEFTAHYSLRDRTPHFDLWFYNGLSQPRQAPAGWADATHARTDVLGP